MLDIAAAAQAVALVSASGALVLLAMVRRGPRQ